MESYYLTIQEGWGYVFAVFISTNLLLLKLIFEVSILTYFECTISIQLVLYLHLLQSIFVII